MIDFFRVKCERFLWVDVKVEKAAAAFNPYNIIVQNRNKRLSFTALPVYFSCDPFTMSRFYTFCILERNYVCLFWGFFFHLYLTMWRFLLDKVKYIAINYRLINKCIMSSALLEYWIFKYVVIFENVIFMLKSIELFTGDVIEVQHDGTSMCISKYSDP